jgi:hypothetical protein
MKYNYVLNIGICRKVVPTTTTTMSILAMIIIYVLENFSWKNYIEMLMFLVSFVLLILVEFGREIRCCEFPNNQTPTFSLEKSSFLLHL